MKSIWFNLLVTVPLILSFWIVFYPIAMIVGGIYWIITEVLPELLDLVLVDINEYTATIKDGVRFITGRIKNK